MSQLKVTVLIVVIFSAPPALAETCPPYSPKKYPGHISGYGMDETYEGAKAKAISDVMQYFGAKVRGDTAIVEDNEESRLSNNSRVSVSAVAKGAEVLSTCASEGRHQLIVGIKKTTMKRLIEERAAHRREQLASGSNETGARYLLRDEARDKEIWALLGYHESLFPSVDVSKFKIKRGHSYNLVASGELAEQTIDAVRKRLLQDGVKFSDSGEVIVWTCTLTIGSPIGEISRFEGKCQLPEFELGVDVVGMARETDILNKAKVMILGKI